MMVRAKRTASTRHSSRRRPSAFRPKTCDTCRVLGVPRSRLRRIAAAVTPELTPRERQVCLTTISAVLGSVRRELRDADVTPSAKTVGAWAEVVPLQTDVVAAPAEVEPPPPEDTLLGIYPTATFEEVLSQDQEAYARPSTMMTDVQANSRPRDRENRRPSPRRSSPALRTSTRHRDSNQGTPSRQPSPASQASSRRRRSVRGSQGSPTTVRGQSCRPDSVDRSSSSCQNDDDRRSSSGSPPTPDSSRRRRDAGRGTT